MTATVVAERRPIAKAGLKNLVLDEIALVEAGYQPVNPDATISVVKAEEVGKLTPTPSSEEPDAGMLARVRKALGLVQAAEETPAGAAPPAAPIVKAAMKTGGLAMSHEEKISKLQSAIKDAHGGYPSVAATYDDQAIYQDYDSSPTKHYAVPYQMGDDGSVTLGTRQEVQPKTSFVPVKKAMDLAADLRALYVQKAGAVPAQNGAEIAAAVAADDYLGQMELYLRLLRESANGAPSDLGGTTPTPISKAASAGAAGATQDMTPEELKAELDTFKTGFMSEVASTVAEQIKTGAVEIEKAVGLTVDAKLAENKTLVSKAIEDAAAAGGITAARTTATPQEGVTGTEATTPISKATPPRTTPSVSNLSFKEAVATLVKQPAPTP